MALAIVGFILAASSLVTTGCGGESETSTGAGAETATSAPPAVTSAVPARTSAYNFGEETKPDHVTRIIPAHRAIMPAPPLKVTIYFDTNLAPPSDIKVNNSGQEYGMGTTEIAEGKMSLPLDPEAPDGLYTVEYTACWEDGSCQDGSFRYAIEQTPGH
jgi:methionine-rich copper-binding protein CopC